MSNEITRIEALNAVLENEEVCGILGEEVTAKLASMAAQLAKPRKKTVTKADKEREALVEAAVAYVTDQGGDKVTPSQLMEHVTGLTSTQKTAAIMKTAINAGLVKKYYDDKGKAFYVAA